MLEKLQKFIEDCYNHAEKNAKTFRDIENYRAGIRRINVLY